MLPKAQVPRLPNKVQQLKNRPILLKLPRINRPTLIKLPDQHDQNPIKRRLPRFYIRRRRYDLRLIPLNQTVIINDFLLALDWVESLALGVEVVQDAQDGDLGLVELLVLEDVREELEGELFG